MNSSGEVLPKESSVERHAIVTDRMVFEIAGFHETALRIHEQSEFVFLVRISQVEDLFAVLCNDHHGPQVHRLAPQCGFGTLRMLNPLEPNSTPLGGREM